MKNKTLMVAAATILAVGTLGVIGALGITQAYAQESENGESPLIIQNLAKAFGVSEDEVETVFEETREQKKDEHLDSLVENGTLTQEQRDALEAKQEEMHSQREEIMNSSMTAEERREAMKTLQDNMESWAEEQGIDLSEFRPERGSGGRGIHREMGEYERGIF